MIRKAIAPAAVLALLSLSLSAHSQTAPSASSDSTAAAAEAPAKEMSYSNKWRIEVSEGANSDGKIVFNVTPKGGATTVVTVDVDDGTSENHVARVIKRAFEKQLDTRKYDIEVDDGEDVLVKKDLTEPVFALVLVSSTVKSVRLNIDKE